MASARRSSRSPSQPRPQCTTRTKSTHSTADARLGIDLAFAIVPAAIIIPAGVAMLFYKLDRRTIAHFEGELAQRRMQSAPTPFPSPPETL